MGCIHQSGVPFAVRNRRVSPQRQEALDKALVAAVGRKEQWCVALAVAEVHIGTSLVRFLNEPDLHALLFLPLCLGEDQQCCVALLICQAQVTSVLYGSLGSPGVLLVDGVDQHNAVLLWSLLLGDHVFELMRLLRFVLRVGITRHLLTPVLQQAVGLDWENLDHVPRRPPQGVLFSGIRASIQQDLGKVVAALLCSHHQSGLT
mmetsp:Transcript_28780/g.67070  ORF Transcript_28780/g.67070 Transcript_28780/m.67070 type:complete len:204 (-) Transcript_28780:1160-1771(-)